MDEDIVIKRLKIIEGKIQVEIKDLAENISFAVFWGRVFGGFLISLGLVIAAVILKYGA